MPDPTAESIIAELRTEMKAVRETVATADAARTSTIEELKKAVGVNSATATDVMAKLERIVADQAKGIEKYQALETTIDELAKQVRRPGAGSRSEQEELERKAAIDLLELKHAWTVQKKDAQHPFTYTEEQVEIAVQARKAMRALIHCPNLQMLSDTEKKALTAFNVGTNGFILAPEMSNTVLSCLEDVSDITGLMQSITIAGPSIRFLVDNVRLDVAAWACESECFANNPQADLNKGLGELEIKPETLRFIICATRDILEDASVDIEAWMLNKVNWAFRNTISNAIIAGSGDGMPRGVLNPRSGIPVCDTSDNTPAGQFTWQDLINLKWQVPVQYHAGARYLMNQDTMGKMLTISDANGRPIMLTMPQDAGTFAINGNPVSVVTVMPNAEPGLTPVAFGNWAQAYMIVRRKAVTMQQDPYSAGFCVLYKFEARVGGAVICSNAARLLRVQ